MNDAHSQLLKQTLFKFLHENFTPWNLNEFSPQDTAELYRRLEEHIPKEDLLRQKIVISKYIKEFFHDLGAIHVRVEPFEQISITTTIKESTLRTFELLQAYKPHFETLEESHLLIINERLTHSLLQKLHSDSDTFKSDIRLTLPLVEDLGPHYAILFGRSKITVRKQLTQVIKEKRFAGLPPDELHMLIQNHFKDVDRRLPKLMKKALLERINFHEISNHEFESTHVKIFQEELEKIIKPRFDQDEEIIKALTNYLLRQQFERLHSILAQQLLSHALDKNSKAEKFLSYYTLSVVSINGLKYQVPQLLDQEGKVWSLINIRNVVSQYQQFQRSIEKKVTHIEQMDSVLETIDDDISKAEKELQVREQRQMIAGNKDERAALEAQEKIKALEYKKTTTKERHASETENLEKIQEQNKEIIQKYALMLTAVIHALAGKKERL